MLRRNILTQDCLQIEPFLYLSNKKKEFLVTTPLTRDGFLTIRPTAHTQPAFSAIFVDKYSNYRVAYALRPS